MTQPAWDSSFVLDAIPCAEGETSQLKLVYNSGEDEHSACAFLEQCGLLSPTATLLKYDHGRAKGYLGIYRSGPWLKPEDRDRYYGNDVSPSIWGNRYPYIHVLWAFCIRQDNERTKRNDEIAD